MLENKVIYIFSPERWGIMKVSKHHYAIQLTLKGNTVYFLEPAIKGLNQVMVSKSDRDVKIVQYPLVARGRRKLPKFAYNYLLKSEVATLVKGIGEEPDIVWSFDPQRLDRFPFFKEALKIFHPVDFYPHGLLPEPRYIDLSFSPMVKEVEDLRKNDYTSFFINHGLSEYFAEFSLKRLEQVNQPGEAFNVQKKINIGYVGNLISGVPDMETMKDIIEQNANIHFHFWGQAERKDSTLTFYDYPEVFEFVQFLKDRTNVSLYGPKDTSDLAFEIQDMDIFWICWKTNDNIMWNKYTNPHKVIEYLSTGKPVVSHYMDYYKTNDLVYSVKPGDTGGYNLLFDQVVDIVRNAKDSGKERGRIKYALDNTYTKHVEKIEKIITEYQSKSHP